MLTGHYRITSIDEGKTHYAEINIEIEGEGIMFSCGSAGGHRLSLYPEDPVILRRLAESLVAAACELEQVQAASPESDTETAA